MEVSAINRYASISPQKARLVLKHLPGKSIEEALTLLKFMTTPHAKIVSKVVKSAASNAENNFDALPDSLYIKRAYADDSRRLKRFRPAARGRIHPYVRRSSHITIIVEEREL